MNRKGVAMEYRRLGASGLKVPALSFGAGTFGGTGPLFGPGAIPTRRRPAGSSTSASTPASRCSTPPTSTRTAPPRRCWARRSRAGASEVLISTKTGLPMGEGPNDAGSSRSRLIAGGRGRAAPARHRLHRPVPAARLRRRHADRGGAVARSTTSCAPARSATSASPTSPAGS